MTYCIRCGTVIADGIRFCNDCGLESTPAQTQPFSDAPSGSSLKPQFEMVLRFAGPILPLIGLFLALYFVVTQPGGIGRLSRPGTAITIVSPTFDCAKAKTLTEQQICRDPQLASLERGMVSSYNQALAQLPGDQKAAFRRKHALWFKDYSRMCNSIPTDETRKNCIASYLTSHTQQLELALRAESTPGDRRDAPQSAPLTGVILGKWYPVSPGPPPHAGLLGYEFLPDGRVREIVYINPVFNGGKDETDILCEDDGYYQIAGSTLTIHVLKNEENFQIAEITQSRLALEERVGTVVGGEIQYARNPSSGYPPFGTHGTISIRFDWPQQTVNFDAFYSKFRSVVSSRDQAALRELMSEKFEWGLDGYVTRDQALNNISQIITWPTFWQSAALAVANAAQVCKPHYCNNRPGYEAFTKTPFPLEIMFESGADNQWHWSAVLGD